MNKVIVLAPAKLNLALDITGLAENGYHTVDMLMQAVGLYEKVQVTKSAGYSLRCPGSRVPTDARNTATKAAKVFFYETGLLAGADIVVHKKVPTRAGMAGGSADAAAVLVGLNALYGARLSMEELCAMGAQVGSDVPFAIVGGTARAQGTGDKLTALQALPACWFVVVMPPGCGVSTPLAYQKYDALENPIHPNIDAAVHAIEAGALSGLFCHMANALEAASADAHTAEIRRYLEALGAQATMMTGSGAAVFGVFVQRTQAEYAAKTLRESYKQVYCVPPVQQGARVVQSD